MAQQLWRSIYIALLLAQLQIGGCCMQAQHGALLHSVSADYNNSRATTAFRGGGRRRYYKVSQ
jgi:hypothetical protein